MLYTSGTSGRPKGVRRALTGEDPDAVPPFTTWFFAIFGLKPFDGHVHLCCSPLYHTAVLNFATISIQLGHPVVLMDRFDPETLLALVERHRVTSSHMVPTQFRRLLALPESVRARYDVSSLRCMIHAAAPCPQEVKRRMLDWWGPVVTEYYAATEGGGSVITAQQWLARPGSVGTAWPGSEVRVLDDNGDDAPTGEPGLVYMRMGTSTFDYHKDRDETLASRARGMFTVGDIGYLDADGYLYLCDRKGDLIITGRGQRLPGRDRIGAVLPPGGRRRRRLRHPARRVGRGDQGGGAASGLDYPGPRADGVLLDFLDGRIAKFKLPRTIDYVAELPRDPNGKLYKRRLRDPYWAARDKSI